MASHGKNIVILCFSHVGLMNEMMLFTSHSHHMMMPVPTVSNGRKGHAGSHFGHLDLTNVMLKSWMFLILFYMYIYLTQKVWILTKQNNNFLSTTSFCQVIYHGFLRCEGKCSSQQQVGIVLKDIDLHNLI